MKDLALQREKIKSMPYKSRAQEAFFNANRDNLEKQGVNVDEWNASSRGLKLPARKKKIIPAVKHPGSLRAAAKKSK